MADLLLSIALGAVQGLTEFLPVSSSGHLVLLPWILRLPDPGLTFDVALHFGTLLALVAYTWRQWLDIVQAAAKRSARGGFGPAMFWKLALASVPAAAVGIFLEEAAGGVLRSPWIIAASLAGVALLMAAADRRPGRGSAVNVGWGQALLVGFAQAAALVPGVSRSGATITAGLFLGLSRAEAARFSFLLAVPVTAGASVFALRHLTAADLTLTFFAGVLVSAATGLWAIRFLMDFLRERNLTPFVLYRLALAASIVFLLVSRR